MGPGCLKAPPPSLSPVVALAPGCPHHRQTSSLSVQLFPLTPGSQELVSAPLCVPLGFSFSSPCPRTEGREAPEPVLHSTAGRRELGGEGGEAGAE